MPKENICTLFKLISNKTNLNSAFEPGDEDTFYITDDRGNTLYHFSNDKNGVNNFTAQDFSNNGAWPIFHTNIQDVPSTLNSNGFGTIDVFRESQLTYKGWPLYYFMVMIVEAIILALAFHKQVFGQH